MAENFDLIFGQSASSQYAWNDSDYQNGWGTVGSTPPTAEQFDALQRRSDKKAQELNNALTPLVNQNTASNRQPLTAYALKDIRYYNELPVGWYLECTTAGTTDSGDITLPTPLVENATITDGTCVWKVRKISSADGMPIGAIIAFGGNGAIPSGYLLCDGAAYSRTAFPDLFAAIGTDYGSGDGSTTFNVPDSNQAKRFLQGDTVAGQTKEAGLPNITGNTPNNPQTWLVADENAYIGQTSGAISVTRADLNTSMGTNGSRARHVVLNFDASRSNSIYGNSTTVQPPALTTRFIIKAFDGQTADSALIDITQYENELGGKADRSLSNLTSEGIAKIVGSVVKGANGYQQLGNGLIVQWGVSQTPAIHSAICSFPIEFSNTNFICVGIGRVLSSDQTWTHTVNEMWDLRTTGRAIFRLSSADGPQVEYVAIGY